MDWKIKLIAYILIIFIWLIAGFVLLELSFRLFNYCVCKINPYIKSLGENAPWFYSGKKIEGKEENSVGISPIPPLVWNTERAKFFFQIDDDDKRLFSECFNMKIYFRLVSEEKFHSPYNEDFDFESLLSQLKFESVEGEDGIEACYFPEYNLDGKLVSNFFSIRTSDGELIWFKERKDIEEANSSPWEVPYMEYKKNYRLPGYEFRTNNVGFRDKDVVIPKPDGVFRIVAIGGSTTEEGPTTDETYPNILEVLLNEKYGDICRIEVINAGIPGITLNKIWIRLPDYLMLQPDLVILSEGVNDITHILFPLWLSNLPHLKRFVSMSDLVISFFPLYFLPPDEVINKDMDEIMFAYLHKISNYLAKKSIPLILTDLPYPNFDIMDFGERAYFQYVTRKWWGGRLVDYRMYKKLVETYNEFLRDWSRKQNLQLVSLSEFYQKQSPSIFNDLCHLKVGGIRLKAEIIRDFIERENLVSCRR